MITLDEFKQLAANPPHKEERTIFRMRPHRIDVDDLDHRQRTEEELDTMSDEELARKRKYYPKFKIESYWELFAETLEQAEKLMHRFLAGDEAEDVYCVEITEVPFGENVYVDYVSRRIYDREGNLVEQTRCGSNFTLWADDRDDYRHYRGRTAEQIRFKPGDIVEVWWGDEVTLQVVVGTPPTIEWCYRYYRGMCEDYETLTKPGTSRETYEEACLNRHYMLDESDDSYTTIDGPGYNYHHHMDSCHVFAPRFPIPKRIENKLRRWYQTTIKEREN